MRRWLVPVVFAVAAIGTGAEHSLPSKPRWATPAVGPC